VKLVGRRLEEEKMLVLADYVGEAFAHGGAEGDGFYALIVVSKLLSVLCDG